MKQQNNQDRSGIIIVILAILSGLVIFTSNAIASLSRMQNITAMPPEMTEIAQYRQSLLSGDIDEQTRLSIQEKLDIAIRIATQIAESSAVQPLGNAPTLIMMTDPPVPMGIFEGDEGIFRPDEVIINNYWQNVIGDEIIQVFAGSSGGESGVGIVIVAVTSADRMQTVFDKFSPGLTFGSLRIVSEQGGIIRLISTNGVELFFNVGNKKFTQ
jgi:hypothetical protein